MDNSKIKNIIIAILVLVNAFLLASVIMDETEQRRSESAAATAAKQVLEKNGIALSPGVDLNMAAPSKCTVLRDADEESNIISSLIGNHNKSDAGGNIFYYSSDNGQASLRGTGETDVIFSNGYVTMKNSQLKTVEKLMGKTDIETHNFLQNSDDTVAALCGWNGFTVYNARLSFTFSGSSLVMMTGVRVFDKLSTQSSEKVMDCLTALMRFVEIVNERYVCSELTDLSVGYIMNVEVSGEAVLTPVWHITTDAGEIYINAVSGREENIS